MNWCVAQWLEHFDVQHLKGLVWR